MALPEANRTESPGCLSNRADHSPGACTPGTVIDTKFKEMGKLGRDHDHCSEMRHKEEQRVRAVWEPDSTGRGTGDDARE